MKEKQLENTREYVVMDDCEDEKEKELRSKAKVGKKHFIIKS